MKRLLLFIPLLILLFMSFHDTRKVTTKPEKPKISLTFDDGNTLDLPGYKWQEWNNLLLNSLRKNNLQTTFFATGKLLDNERGKHILAQWNKHGHLIANHTYSHNSYNSPNTTFEDFSLDFLKNDSLIKSYTNYTKLFRFPYLKEGDTEYKRDQFREFLKAQHYKNGYVTIDASDWCVNSRLIRRLKLNPQADIEPYRQFYLNHLYERAVYYNDLSLKLTGRQINHTLLLHHNLSSALFVDDLIKMFKAKGWDVINTSEAYKDNIYSKIPNTMPAGESLIWALAKESNAYESILRYPAEDSKYEEPLMDKLGL